MKRIIPFLFLAVAAFAQVNVQKTSGTNAITGNLVIGDGKALSATGTGSIGATALTGNVTANGSGGIALKTSGGTTVATVGGGTLPIALVGSADGPVMTTTAGARSAYHEFFRSGYTSRAAFGMLGSPEANVSYNMDYSTGVHRLYNTSDGAAWSALHSGAWAVQWAFATVAAGDVWTASGRPYAVYQEIVSGKMILKTDFDSVTAGGFSAILTVPRNGGAASISGVGDFVLEGAKTTGTAGVVYINPYNVGDVWIATGGGQAVFPGGSASAPAIRSSTGTANTGIYFPSADNIVVATNGVARILTDENGITTVQRTPVNGAGLVVPLIVRTDAATEGDSVGVLFNALDSGTATQTYGRMLVTINNATASSETATITLAGAHSGSLTDFVTLTGNVATFPGAVKTTGIEGISTNAVTIGTSGTTRITVKGTGVINFASLPTSASGLSSGDLWSNSGVLTVVP